MLTDALAQLPEGLRGRVIVGGDSGAGTHRFVEHLDQLGLGYSVGLAGWPTILDALENVPRQAWKAALDSDGFAREGAQVRQMLDRHLDARLVQFTEPRRPPLGCGVGALEATCRIGDGHLVDDHQPAELETSTWRQSSVSVHEDLPVVKWVP